MKVSASLWYWASSMAAGVRTTLVSFTSDRPLPSGVIVCLVEVMDTNRWAETLVRLPCNCRAATVLARPSAAMLAVREAGKPRRAARVALAR